MHSIPQLPKMAVQWAREGPPLYQSFSITPAPHLGEIRSASLIITLEVDCDVVPVDFTAIVLHLMHLCSLMKHAEAAPLQKTNQIA